MPEPQPAAPPQRTGQPTIYDVAQACGVSPSTVSRAFSRPGRVRADTTERIRHVAQELGYRLPLARPCATSRSTGLVALVIPEVSNPFYLEIVHGAEAAAEARGYGLVLTATRGCRRPEREVIAAVSERVDGLLLAMTRLSDAAIRMAAKLRPLVVLNRAVADVPSVLADDPHGMWCTLQHLGQLGHDGVTYVAGPEASFADGTRWRAARDLAARLGLRVRRIGPFSPDVDGGRDAAAELLARPSSAVITFNDLMALGLLAALQGAGVRVPADVSVVGFDNVFGTEFSSPALTTVAAPVRAMGAVGARRLLAEICGSPRPATGPTVLPVRLVVRASTAQRSRKSTSPACGTTRVSGSLAQAFGLTSAGSR